MKDRFAQEQRFYELIADEQLMQLSAEDLGELESLRRELQLPEPNTLGEALIAMDQQSNEAEQMPEHLIDSVCKTGRALVRADAAPVGRIGEERKPSRMVSYLSIAAVVAIAGVSTMLLSQSKAERVRLESAFGEQLAESKAAQDDLAGRLALAIQDLSGAQQIIAQYETPMDPTRLLAQREELLTVPKTIQIAWQPFDQGDSLAEQGNVQGDVIWNDELQEGYLRFVGLEVNDPSIEQYQVWVIDDRGLEQRVSGGVFNASASGEVVVSIEPGIDMGRVALFAITIEEPGGTWVSDLQRRVVVAPRGEG